MADYKKFRIEAQHNDTVFRVLVKGWFGWRSAYIATDYFSIQYSSIEEALEAIKGYKKRIIEVD